MKIYVECVSVQKMPAGYLFSFEASKKTQTDGIISDKGFQLTAPVANLFQVGKVYQIQFNLIEKP